MGWMHDKIGHEGYAVALERIRDDRGSYDWHEITYGRMCARVDAEQAAGRPVTIRVEAVQAGCDCGWRSERLSAPLGTIWTPYIVSFPRVVEEQADDAIRALWLEHMATAIDLSSSDRNAGGRMRRVLEVPPVVLRCPRGEMKCPGMIGGVGDRCSDCARVMT